MGGGDRRGGRLALARSSWPPGRRRQEIGRPCYAALPLLKAIYLQALYDLSDPRLEEALADRLSFRRFCGCDLEEPTPDETTICRFRNALAEPNVRAERFCRVNAHLDRKGLILRKGTIVDATAVAAVSRKPRVKQGKAATLGREPGARWTCKNGRSYFGYCVHIGGACEGGSKDRTYHRSPTGERT